MSEMPRADGAAGAGEGREGALRESWEANAGGWTAAVRKRAIESRRVATDAAVVDAVTALHPRRVLDVGCGEGWLARDLAGRGIEVLGIDASAPLIEAARASGGAAFAVCSYEELVAEPERVGGGFDVAVCNFSLLAERVAPVLEVLAGAVSPTGSVLIQTVHPWTGRGQEGYSDGWRTETFTVLAPVATLPRPMPWFFRTMESWIATLDAAGLRLGRLVEPRHPETGDPLSLLMIAEPR